jgi:heptosyltransferase-2/heptosyltransferase-3
VDYLLRLARVDPPGFAGAAPGAFPEPPPAPRLALAPAEIEDCRRWLGGRGWSGEPVVVLQALARRRKRGRWPEASWIAAARGILERLPAARLLVAGAATEVAEAARLAAAAGDPRVSSVAGELPLRRLFALLTLAHSAVSLDSGPAHAAAALGCPVVVLAGTADPRRNRPLGGPGLVLVVDGFAGAWPESAEEWFARHEVARIAPASVLAAWEELARRDPAG